MPEPIFASVQCISWPLQVHLHLSQINQSGVRTLPDITTAPIPPTKTAFICAKTKYQVPPI